MGKCLHNYGMIILDDGEYKHKAICVLCQDPLWYYHQTGSTESRVPDDDKKYRERK